jgi:putative hydrolase of the HAD superfamily
MRSDIKGVAFDLDGTLYPNYRLNIRLIPFVLTNLPLLMAFGKARDQIRAEQKIFPTGFYEAQADYAARFLKADPALIKEKIERCIYRGWEPLFKKIKLFPHVIQTLEALKNAGLKLGLLSDFPPELKLEHLGLGGFWDAVLCSEQIGALKPDPLSFQELARAMGLAPAEILYVGNSRVYDVEGAKRAGMKAALVTGFPKSPKTQGPDFVFFDYRQLSEYMLR